MAVLHREITLHRYMCYHANQTEFIRTGIDRDAAAKSRLNRKNRSIGPRHRNWVEINRAALRELGVRGTHTRLSKCVTHEEADRGRERDQFSDQPGDHCGTAVAHRDEFDGSGKRFPLQYALDVQRGEREIDADELFVRNRTVLEKTS